MAHQKKERSDVCACTKEYHHDVAFDELGDILDSMIEIGDMTKEEYQAKVKDFVCSL